MSRPGPSQRLVAKQQRERRRSVRHDVRACAHGRVSSRQRAVCRADFDNVLLKCEDLGRLNWVPTDQTWHRIATDESSANQIRTATRTAPSGRLLTTLRGNVIVDRSRLADSLPVLGEADGQSAEVGVKRIVLRRCRMALVHKTFAGPLAADDEHRSRDLHETPSAPILQSAKWAAFRGAQQTPSAPILQSAKWAAQEYGNRGRTSAACPFFFESVEKVHFFLFVAVVGNYPSFF